MVRCHLIVNYSWKLTKAVRGWYTPSEVLVKGLNSFRYTLSQHLSDVLCLAVSVTLHHRHLHCLPALKYVPLSPYLKYISLIFLPAGFSLPPSSVAEQL